MISYGISFFRGVFAGIFISCAFLISIALLQSPTKHTPLMAKSHHQITIANSQKATLILSPTLTASMHQLLPQAHAQEVTNTSYCLYVPVLYYHHIEPMPLARSEGHGQLTVDSAIFEEQMQYLVSHGYTTITARQLFEALKNHTTLAPKSIVLTFDDGYIDIYQYAYPIFQKYHLTANLMIPTGLIGGPDYMTWDMLSEMQKSGLIYFVNHTWSHHDVAQGDLSKNKFEIETAKDQLEQHTGQQVDVFTYPYGQSSPTALQILKDDNYIGAFTTIEGTYECDTDMLTEPRVRIGNGRLSTYGL